MSAGRNILTDDVYDVVAGKWSEVVAPRLNMHQRTSLAALLRRMVRAAAEPEACVFCKHIEPHTAHEGRCHHVTHGCTAPGCTCDAYETAVRP